MGSIVGSEVTAAAISLKAGVRRDPVPKKEDINIDGLAGQVELMDDLLIVDKSLWMDECELIAEHQAQFGSSLPIEMKQQFENLKSKLA